MKLLNKLFILIFLLVISFSCSEEDYLIENPPHIIAADNLYTDVAGFEAGLNGLYRLVSRERGGESWGSSNDLMIDPAVTGVDNCFGNQRSGWAKIGNEWGTKNQPTDGHYRNFWNWLYQTINSANTIINRAETQKIDWTEAEKNQVVAEARLIRAWCYRHLTFMWGDVPLNLEESDGASIKTDWQRTPFQQVLTQIEDDLLFAETHLSETSDNPGKIVKGVATHYLAELYLTMNDPASAKVKAEALINSGVFNLITERYGVNTNKGGTPFTDMFLDGNSNKHEGNTEALWVIQNEVETIGGEGNNCMRRWHRGRSHSIKVDGVSGVILLTVENGGRGLGRIGPTRWAMENYEEGDDRGSIYAWHTFEVLNNPDKIPDGWVLGDTTWFDWQGKDEKIKNNYWPSTRKWDYANPNDLAGARSYNDQVYLRLAETYLLLAEAQLKLNDAGGAAETINVLRRRANASEIGGNDVTIDFILDERSRELYSEEHRRYTLLRLGKWFERTQLYNKVGGTEITERDKLFPIPQDVIDANLTTPMEQNPGY